MNNKKIKGFFSIIIISLGLTGCATHPCQTKITCDNVCEPKNPDPFECFNRKIYSINCGLDKAIIRPVAKAYVKVSPTPVKSCIFNFFANLNDITVTINDLLQINLPQALRDAVRFALNTSFGMLGFIDVASSAGLPKNEQDFGVTLGKWGVKHSPYLMLPILGPSTVRDGIGIAGDWYIFSIWDYITNPTLKYSLLGLNLINLRANLLDAEKFLDAISVDPYIALRDAYLQKREHLIAGDIECGAAVVQTNDDFDKDNYHDEFQNAEPKGN